MAVLLFSNALPCMHCIHDAITEECIHLGWEWRSCSVWFTMIKSLVWKLLIHSCTCLLFGFGIRTSTFLECLSRHSIFVLVSVHLVHGGNDVLQHLEPDSKYILQTLPPWIYFDNVCGLPTQDGQCVHHCTL